MESVLYSYSEKGMQEEAKRLLGEHPDIDINWNNPRNYNQTALHAACKAGHVNIVSLLLSHPLIDVNSRDIDGGTPFYRSCVHGSTACAKFLLDDPRVAPNEKNYEGNTPLWTASFWGHLDTVKMWIASGKEIGLGQPGNVKSDPILGVQDGENFRGVSVGREKNEFIKLLERFKSDPDGVRSELRTKEFVGVL